MAVDVIAEVVVTCAAIVLNVELDAPAWNHVVTPTPEPVTTEAAP